MCINGFQDSVFTRNRQSRSELQARPSQLDVTCVACVCVFLRLGLLPSSASGSAKLRVTVSTRSVARCTSCTGWLSYLLSAVLILA